MHPKPATQQDDRAAQRAQHDGFTLIEVLLVVVIIGILVGVAVPRFSGRVAQSQISATRMTIRNVGLALNQYEVDNGRYPESLQALIQRGSEGNWNGPYLEGGRLPQDAWGQEFRYTRRDNAFEVRSAGPDGQFGTEDDLWN